MQNDFEQTEIEEMIPENHSSPPKSGPPTPRLWRVNKKHFFKFGIIFAVILILVAGGFYAWDNYFSPSARSARQAEANYQKYLDWQKNYEAAMTADTYGGKTPEETLAMFVDAMKNKDVDLAVSYFLLDDNGKRNPKIKTGIEKLFSENKVAALLETLSKLEPSTHDTGDSEIKDYVTLTPDGIVNHLITLKLNKYSNIWKIENM